MNGFTANAPRREAEAEKRGGHRGTEAQRCAGAVDAHSELNFFDFDLLKDVKVTSWPLSLCVSVAPLISSSFATSRLPVVQSLPGRAA